MRPVLQVWVEGGRYAAYCYACDMMCVKRGASLTTAVCNLPCSSVRSIDATIRKMEEER